ncbi:hypothetical protein H4I96_03964 [Botrytis cinerea]
MFKTAGRLAWVVVSENAEWGEAGQGRREGQGRGANKVDGMGSVWSIRKAYDLWLWDVLSVGCCNSLSTICILYYLSSVAALNGRKRNHNSTTKKLLGFCWFWLVLADVYGVYFQSLTSKIPMFRPLRLLASGYQSYVVVLLVQEKLLGSSGVGNVHAKVKFVSGVKREKSIFG